MSVERRIRLTIKARGRPVSSAVKIPFIKSKIQGKSFCFSECKTIPQKHTLKESPFNLGTLGLLQELKENFTIMFAGHKKGCGKNNSWSELWNIRFRFLNYMPKCTVSRVTYTVGTQSYVAELISPIIKLQNTSHCATGLLGLSKMLNLPFSPALHTCRFRSNELSPPNLYSFEVGGGWGVECPRFENCLS